MRPNTDEGPLVSAVLIFLNEERYLEEAVRSVCDQTLADWELILVDDGSTDRSTSIARDLAAKDQRIHYVDHPGHHNRGMSASRNLGVANATGRYIAFLDSDDVWPPGKLADQVDLLEKMPDVAMVVGAILLWHSWDPAATKPDCVVLPGGMAERRLDVPEALLGLYPLGRARSAGVTGLVRRSAFEEVGGFEERFRGLFEDQAFLAKVYLRYPTYITSQTGYRYRQHDASCCRRTSRADSVRLRAAYLEWLASYVAPVSDPRVLAAVERARRQIPYRRLIAPALEVFDRLPEESQRRLYGLVGRSLD